MSVSNNWNYKILLPQLRTEPGTPTSHLLPTPALQGIKVKQLTGGCSHLSRGNMCGCQVKDSIHSQCYNNYFITKRVNVT